VSSLARQHASNPALLSSTLALGEGLLEYAKNEGLSHTSALLSSTILKVHQRLEQVQDSRTTALARVNAGMSGLSSMESQDAKLGDRTASSSSRDDASSSKDGLRRRLASQPTKEVASKQAPGPQCLIAETPEPPASSGNSAPCLKEAAICSLRGFHPREVEQQYALWVAASWSRIVFLHCFILTLFIAASLVNIAKVHGLQAFFLHLPFHLVCASIYTASAVFALYQQHRWVSGFNRLGTQARVPETAAVTICCATAGTDAAVSSSPVHAQPLLSLL
jgi:hypothetical protein